MPRGTEFHLLCTPFKERWHCVGQALGFCSESVPTGRPSAYGLKFALRNTMELTQPLFPAGNQDIDDKTGSKLCAMLETVRCDQ